MMRLRGVIRFERRHEPLAPPLRFLGRMLVYWGIVGIASAVTLGIGVMGYHWLAGLPWVDAILEAALILGGMGPLHSLPNATAKLFAAAYALFSGLFFIAAMGVIATPVLHRILHHLHVEIPESIEGEQGRRAG